MSTVLVKSYSDAKCVGHLFQAEKNDKKEAVVIACAMGITQKYYKNLSTYLSENGYDVLTFDYRGTGESAPKDLKNYKISLIEWGKDISSSIDFLVEEGYEKIYFIGHSIGSQLMGFAPSNKHIQKAVFLASSIGYWKLIGGMEKWTSLVKLNTILPISNAIWGYTNSKAFGQGENYPKSAAEQWRKWCHHPEYLKVDQTEENNYFHQFDQSIQSYIFSDDKLANPVNGRRLLDLYPKSASQLHIISPDDLEGISKIGHTGFLSRKLKDTFWNQILEELKS